MSNVDKLEIVNHVIQNLTNEEKDQIAELYVVKQLEQRLRDIENNYKPENEIGKQMCLKNLKFGFLQRVKGQIQKLQFKKFMMSQNIQQKFEEEQKTKIVKK